MRKRWLRKNDLGYEAFVEDLRQIVSEGYSMKEVAEMFGTAEEAVTKNAVAGCTHRNGIFFGIKDSEKGGSTKNPARSKKILGAPSRESQDNILVYKPLPILLPTVEVNKCQWPFGDPKEPDFHLCGNTNLVRGLKYMVYCQEHHEMAYHQEKKRPAQPFQF